MKIGIVGATGMVGFELIKILLNNGYSDLQLCASDTSIDTNLYGYKLLKLDDIFFDLVHITFFCTENDISKKWIPVALSKNNYVIDNSSEFRMDKDVPLIVPEINSYLLNKTSKLIANPNCTAAILCMTLHPLLGLSKIKRVDVSTYQAVSGAGKAGMDELDKQMKQYVEKDAVTSKIFNSQIVNNCFSHNSSIDKESGYNGEELKIINETQKILNNYDMEISATCVRIPVMRAHCESVKIVFENSVIDDDIRKVLSSFEGITIIDDREHNIFPEPILCSGKTNVFVGRIRKDYYDKENKIYHMFICGDQLMKGAAYNAYQIFLEMVNSPSVHIGVAK
jgi:aspartate-semialdehyde dehydrogenase